MATRAVSGHQSMESCSSSVCLKGKSYSSVQMIRAPCRDQGGVVDVEEASTSSTRCVEGAFSRTYQNDTHAHTIKL